MKIINFHYSVILALVMCVILSCSLKKSHTYYIDYLSGNDANSGLSDDKAWKTSSNLRNFHLKPGDSLLFKVVYSGSIVLDSILGTENSPVTISSYGNGNAEINAAQETGIYVSNSQYLNIKNITVKGGGRLNGNNGNGIQMVNCKHCLISNVDASGFMWSGVNIVGGSNINISEVYAHDNGFCGIYAESGKDHYEGAEFKALRNIKISHSIAENNPGCPLVKDNHSGSGILLGGVVNGIVEYCEAMNNGWDMPRGGNGPVGIWAYMSDSVVIQYCYSHHNKTSVNGKDGGGFDFDGGMTNSIMQYNLSAFNEGAGFGIFQYSGATNWENNIMCFNISYYDGAKNGRAGILMWYDPSALPMKNFKAFNNTIIGKYEYSVNFEPGMYSDFSFKNNIFLLTGKSDRFIGGDFTKAIFNNNNYWCLKKEAENKDQPAILIDNHPLIANPNISVPDSTIQNLAEIGSFSSLNYFLLNQKSTCIDKGVNIDKRWQKDFWNKKVSNNIGADCHTVDNTPSL